MLLSNLLFCHNTTLVDVVTCVRQCAIVIIVHDWLHHWYTSNFKIFPLTIFYIGPFNVAHQKADCYSSLKYGSPSL